jgi:hypothetical protein
VAANVFAEVKDTTMDVEGADNLEGTRDVGPTVAASWNKLADV